MPTSKRSGRVTFRKPKSGRRAGRARILATRTQTELGFKGKRSGLFYRFMDLARKVHPRWIVLENVIGLLSAEDGGAFESVTDELEEVGYFGAGVVLVQHDRRWSAPQPRTRIRYRKSSIGRRRSVHC